MKRFKNILIAGLVAVMSMTSCLDKYPGAAIPVEEAMETYSDAQQHLVGIYAALLSSNLHSGLLTLLPDIQADLVYAVEGFSNTYGNIWQWDIKSTDSEIEAVYGSLYAVIGNCNFFLDKIDAVMDAQTDDEKIDVLVDSKGQVHAIRALCYLELTKFYCKAYDPATAANTPGVVLRTKYFEDEKMVRSSLKETYELIISDLEKAEEMINDEDVNNGPNGVFFSAACAWALHARAALYMQDWDTAVEYSSKLIDHPSKLFRLASVNAEVYDSTYGYVSEFDYMWAYDYSPEVIWRIGFTSTSYGGALGSLFLGFTRDFTYFYPDYVPAQWVLSAYSSGDERYYSYFADANSGIVIGNPSGMNWPLLVKYYGNRSLLSTSTTTFMHVNMPMPLRLAEQYLIRAEAYCNKGDFTSASTDINTLHSQRYTSGGSVSLTAENWLETISDERAKELYLEGYRLHDLKRWNMGFKREKQSYSLAEGSTLEVKAGDPLFVWPIPQHELDVPGSEVEPNESNRR